MEKLLFEVENKYIIKDDDVDGILNQIIFKLRNRFSMNITKIEKIGLGQNINYKVYTNNQTVPRYLLRIISRKGYPCIKTLKDTYQLLREIDLETPEIIYDDLSNQIVPYGYFLQTWIDGVCVDENNDLWIEYMAYIMKKVNQIKLNYFGYIGHEPKYQSLKEYFYNMDEMINHSFGQVFKQSHSIWDLEKYEFTSPSFLTHLFDNIRGLADKIKVNTLPRLTHGDMLPQNLILTNTGPTLIDWDEARAGWWVYDIARTMYYIKDKSIFEKYVKLYDEQNASMEDILIGVRLEHIRQLLRQMFLMVFNTKTNEIEKKRKQIKEMEKRVISLI